MRPQPFLELRRFGGAHRRDGRATKVEALRADLPSSFSSFSFTNSGEAALTAVPVRRKIWETTALSLSRNLLRFRSPTARSDGAEEAGAYRF
jgi:hypothetical protein